MQPKNEELLKFASKLADASGEILRGYFQKPLEVEQKSDASPVTLADREVESALHTLIETHYPDHGIVGEEFGNVRPESDYQWVLDPIDGTKAFIAGKTTFTTLIALLHNGAPIIGIIDQPILRERYGMDVPKISNNKTLVEAAIATTSMDYFTEREAEAFARLRQATASTTLGGDAYAYAMLTTGKLDIVVDAHMKPYDYLALVPVIESAGGIITDWAGKPLTLHSDGTVIAAASKELQNKATKLLNSKD